MAAEITGRLADIGTHDVGGPSLVTAAASVKALSPVADQGEVCQAVPLSYQQRLLIKTRALESDGLHRQLLASWLLMLSGMVRSEHLQHSKIWIESGVLTCLAQHGKTRRHGGRRPLSLALSEGHTGSVVPLWLAVRGAAGPGYFLENFKEDGLALRGTNFPRSLNRFLFVSRSAIMEPPFCWTNDITDNIPHLQCQESAAVHCGCPRPQLHRSGLARYMGWVDGGVLGTTHGFALGHASSLLGGAVVECPYRPRLHFEVCLGGPRGWFGQGRGLG